MSLQSWQETLITAQVDGTAVTAAAATTLLPAAAKFTLPPNFFAIGKQLLIRATGKISSLVTTPGTARFDVRFGGTVVFDGQAVLLDTTAGHTNVAWWLEILLTCRAIGATGNLIGGGIFGSEVVKGVGTAPLGSLVANLPWSGTVPAVGNNFDTTTTEQVDLFFTQTVATGSITLQQYTLASLN